MEAVLCELLQQVLCHLDVPHFGALQRTSKGLRRAIKRYEEWYLSSVRMVQIYRERYVYDDGKVRLMCINNFSGAEVLVLDPVQGARDIILQMWELKNAKEHTKCSVFVSTRMADLKCPVPCFVFKTKTSMADFERKFGRHCFPRWCIYIACKKHSYEPCLECPRPQRFAMRV